MKLWLDDIRKSPTTGDWYWVKTVWEALTLLLNYHREIDAWSLDHDLGENQLSGYDFLSMLDLMMENGLNIHIPINNIRVHSMNPVGYGNMKKVLESIAAKLERE